jgi:hypothetical protein
MCMEDVRLGREATSATRTVPIAAGATGVIANRNSKRVALHITATGAADGTVSPAGTVPSATAGFAVNSSTGAIRRRIVDLDGDCWDEWNGFGGAAGVTFTVTESFLERK